MGKIRQTFDFFVGLCTILSCVAAVYGVFKVVSFVIEVNPIIKPIAKEVKEGKLDALTIFSRANTTILHDTVRVIVSDTIYIPDERPLQTNDESSSQQSAMRARPTKEDEERLDNSKDIISEQETQEINDKEEDFRRRMREKMNY